MYFTYFVRVLVRSSNRYCSLVCNGSGYHCWGCICNRSRFQISSTDSADKKGGDCNLQISRFVLYANRDVNFNLRICTFWLSVCFQLWVEMLNGAKGRSVRVYIRTMTMLHYLQELKPRSGSGPWCNKVLSFHFRCIIVGVWHDL